MLVLIAYLFCSVHLRSVLSHLFPLLSALQGCVGADELTRLFEAFLQPCICSLAELYGEVGRELSLEM